MHVALLSNVDVHQVTRQMDFHYEYTMQLILSTFIEIICNFQQQQVGRRSVFLQFDSRSSTIHAWFTHIYVGILMCSSKNVKQDCMHFADDDTWERSKESSKHSAHEVLLN
jgi:hypothetical protein